VHGGRGVAAYFWSMHAILVRGVSVFPFSHLLFELLVVSY